MGKTYPDPGTGKGGAVPQTKRVVIYAVDASTMNSSTRSFLPTGNEFISYSGTGADDEEAGFPINIPNDFVSVSEIIIEHTTAATVNTVNYKIDINNNDTNYNAATIETLTFPVRAGSVVSWDTLSDTQTPVTATFIIGQDYSFRTHRDAALDTYTGSSFIRRLIFIYNTI